MGKGVIAVKAANRGLRNLAALGGLWDHIAQVLEIGGQFGFAKGRDTMRHGDTGFGRGRCFGCRCRLSRLRLGRRILRKAKARDKGEQQGRRGMAQEWRRHRVFF